MNYLVRESKHWGFPLAQKNNLKVLNIFIDYTEQSNRAMKQ